MGSIPEGREGDLRDIKDRMDLVQARGVPVILHYLRNRSEDLEDYRGPLH